MGHLSWLEASNPDTQLQTSASLKPECEQLSSRSSHGIGNNIEENPHPNQTPDDASELSDWREDHSTPGWRVTEIPPHQGVAEVMVKAGWEILAWGWLASRVISGPLENQKVKIQVLPDPRVNALKPASADWQRPRFAWTWGKSAAKCARLAKPKVIASPQGKHSHSAAMCSPQSEMCWGRV